MLPFFSLLAFFPALSGLLFSHFEFGRRPEPPALITFVFSSNRRPLAEGEREKERESSREWEAVGVASKRDELIVN